MKELVSLQEEMSCETYFLLRRCLHRTPPEHAKDCMNDRTLAQLFSRLNDYLLNRPDFSSVTGVLSSGYAWLFFSLHRSTQQDNKQEYIKPLLKYHGRVDLQVRRSPTMHVQQQHKRVEEESVDRVLRALLYPLRNELPFTV